MNKTPLLEFVFNRKKTAATNREAAVELRITFERKQKYMTTGIRLLPKHWHRGTVVNRIDARELNETLEKLMAEVRQVILDMMGESVMDIFSIQERLKRKRASAISFLEFCEQRTKIRQYGKTDVVRNVTTVSCGSSLHGVRSAISRMSPMQTSWHWMNIWQRRG